jgi:hypothetical protein
MLSHVVCYKLTDVSGMPSASIIQTTRESEISLDYAQLRNVISECVWSLDSNPNPLYIKMVLYHAQKFLVHTLL